MTTDSTAVLTDGIINIDIYRVRERLVPGARVIDIGANVGVFAAYAAAMGCNVIAVEPSPVCLAQLEVALAPYSSRIVAAACGSTPGACRIQPLIPEEPTAGVYTIWDEGTVPVVTLAQLLAQTPAAVVKIDTEGAEYDIITACPSPTLALIDYLTIEFHAWRPVGSEPDGMQGERGGSAWTPDLFGRMVRHLSDTHRIIGYTGTPASGGMLYAERRA